MKNRKFYEINSAQELVSYLKEPQRINSVKYFNKYMGLDTLKIIFETEKLLINNPQNMNDLYEYRLFDNCADWSKICFASFITQSTESMAMWSMYAQPWTKGVMISIPQEAMKKLINTTKKLISAKFDNKLERLVPGDEIIPADKNLSLARVAYYNENSISCTGRDDRNKNFKNAYEIPELAGYIKDSAWDYEKEVRLRVDIPKEYESNAVFIELSKDFLEQIIITTGPRFEGNVLTILPKEYRHKVKIETSKFKEKIAWIPCDSCIYKNNNQSL